MTVTAGVPANSISVPFHSRIRRGMPPPRSRATNSSNRFCQNISFPPIKE